MNRREYEAEFSGSEIVALETLRQEISDGRRSEVIEYQPYNPALLSSIELYRLFPGLLDSPSVEEPFDPLERIAGLAGALDTMIMNHDRRHMYYTNSYEVRGLKTDEDTFINIRRSIFAGQLEIMAEQILDIGNTYPRIESERFHLSENGYFSRSELQRSSPLHICSSVTTAWYNSSCETFDEETAATLNYFTDLVKPFLIEE
jgi:hypothetical protein